MRGADRPLDAMFTYLAAEQWVQADHPGGRPADGRYGAPGAVARIVRLQAAGT
jgi:hypothetical protein